MAEKAVKVAHLSCRNDTSTNWTLKNPILKKGEWGLETDTFSMKFGDGVSEWNSLVYAGKKGDKGDKGDTGNSGVYVGSGDMPEGYNVQIDINGDASVGFATKEEVQAMIDASLGVIENGYY